jgi:hypothetical protein
VGYNASNRLYLGGTYGLDSGFYTGSVASLAINQADLDIRAVANNYNAFFSRFGLTKTPGLVTDFDAINFIEAVGLNNETQFNSTGKGYEWCACAVTTWWKSAGLKTPPGGTLVSNWVKWGVQNGLYSQKPVLGAAIIYKSGGSYIHIGIVSGVMPDGTVISIEGNASKKGFSARGICCREGVAWMSGIDGYVIPFGCQ